MAGLTEWHVDRGPSPYWHKILVVGLFAKGVAEVAYTVGYSKGGAGGWFLVGGTLVVELRDGTRFPHREDAWTMSYDSELTSKSGWVLGFGVHGEGASVVEVEDNAFFSVAAVYPGWPPAYPFEPYSSDTVGALVVSILK